MTGSKSAIIVDGISKSYKISHQLERNAHPTLRDDLMHFARKPLQWMGAAGGVEKEEFWALKDISFNVSPGDAVAIMGPNGSGKSTLFKILSRVTQPTTGKAVLNGRTASLLEVGTGFHQELSGRENVYFNGAILGMRKSEIDKKFDEIVAFSEVEKFIDTPVKFYSSGMKVRLAFSVAAHLKPDILIIDEVLAVGDVKFKQKSIKHMQGVSAEGTTILFVSHIVSQIKQICNRGVVLNHGQLILDSPLNDAIDEYLKLNTPDEDKVKTATFEGHNTGEVVFEDMRVAVGKPTSMGVDLKFETQISNTTSRAYDALSVAIMVADLFNRGVAVVSTQQRGVHISLEPNERRRVVFSINNAPLAPGEYSFRANLANAKDKSEIYHRVVDTITFHVPEYQYHDYAMSSINRSASSVLLDFDVEHEPLK